MAGCAHYKRPESVLVVVYTDAGEVLLLSRMYPPGFWQSVTGSLEWGELPQQAAVRELFEETGLQGYRLNDCNKQYSFAIRPEWRDRFAPEVTENTEHVFTLKLDDKVTIQLNPEEHSEYCWLPLEQAAEKVFSWTNKEAILGLRNR